MGTEVAMNFVYFVKEQLLQNFMKYFFGPWANQIVNKRLNGESSCPNNSVFSAS